MPRDEAPMQGSPVTKARVLGTVAWVLIFAGAAIGILGGFLWRPDEVLGLALVAAGAADVVAGIGLMVWRARLKDNEEKR